MRKTYSCIQWELVPVNAVFTYFPAETLFLWVRIIWENLNCGFIAYFEN